MYIYVRRYPLVKVGKTALQMPRETKPLSVHFHGSELVLHALVKSNQLGYFEPRWFESIAEGINCTDFLGNYVGWAMQKKKIYHVFEI